MIDLPAGRLRMILDSAGNVVSLKRVGKIYDRNWNLLRVVHAAADGPAVRSGGQTISFSCKFIGNPKPFVSVIMMTRGKPETVQAPEL
ncbi:hypothetical protein J4772_00610 [Cohnella sp. LGH]|uniref:hypothetical protein n=1 Tax=Cohnella sp. LGH TaxID=1619153 RepID=UPI001ADAD69F|nr:hypothetical protein [Cohnella sp. LGH]QTH43030.1 hypothetical protein J4772_00610 [Cohnella sp. LGH]